MNDTSFLLQEDAFAYVVSQIPYNLIGLNVVIHMEYFA